MADVSFLLSRQHQREVMSAEYHGMLLWKYVPEAAVKRACDSVGGLKLADRQVYHIVHFYTVFLRIFGFGKMSRKAGLLQMGNCIEGTSWINSCLFWETSEFKCGSEEICHLRHMFFLGFVIFLLFLPCLISLTSLMTAISYQLLSTGPISDVSN